MRQDIWNKTLLAATLVAVIILVISLVIIWNLSGTLVARLSVIPLGLAFGAAAGSYFLRAVRLYLLLVRSGVPISLPSTLLAQAVGLALSITPAAAGEVLKLRLIQERAGAPILQTAPVFILERLLEAVGFVLFALATAAALPSVQNQLPDGRALIAGAMLLSVIVVVVGRFHGRAGLESWLQRSAVGRRLVPALRSLGTGIQRGFNFRQISMGLALTALARITDGLVLFLAAAVLGVPIALPAAVLILALSGAAGSVSMLPGGAGAVEAAMAGLLVLTGAPFSSALAIAILARLSSLWLWVALGLALVFLLKLAPARATRPLRF